MTDLITICQWCEEKVDNSDPRVPPGLQPMHFECSVRATVGSVEHQSKRCSCYGGTFEDPPEATKRESAIAATLLFLATL